MAALAILLLRGDAFGDAVFVGTCEEGVKKGGARFGAGRPRLGRGGGEDRVVLEASGRDGPDDLFSSDFSMKSGYPSFFTSRTAASGMTLWVEPAWNCGKDKEKENE